MCGDMTAMPLRRQPTFDLALLLFGTLGQFPGDHVPPLLTEVRLRLRPRGRLVVDVLSKEWHTASVSDESWWSPLGAEGVVVHDTLTKREGDEVIIRRCIRTDRGERTYSLRQRLFTPEGLSRLLKDAGYVEVQTVGVPRPRRIL